MEVEVRNSVSYCQIYFLIAIGTIQILKRLDCDFICSVARDYHENNKVKYFLA